MYRYLTDICWLDTVYRSEWQSVASIKYYHSFGEYLWKCIQSLHQILKASSESATISWTIFITEKTWITTNLDKSTFGNIWRKLTVRKIIGSLFKEKKSLYLARNNTNMIGSIQILAIDLTDKFVRIHTKLYSFEKL